MLKELSLEDIEVVVGGSACEPRKKYSQQTIAAWRAWDRKNPQAAARLHRRQAAERAAGCVLPARVDSGGPARRGASLPAIGDVEGGGALD
jgi:hypothetical protein